MHNINDETHQGPKQQHIQYAIRAGQVLIRLPRCQLGRMIIVAENWTNPSDALWNGVPSSVRTNQLTFQNLIFNKINN